MQGSDSRNPNHPIHLSTSPAEGKLPIRKSILRLLCTCLEHRIAVRMLLVMALGLGLFQRAMEFCWDAWPPLGSATSTSTSTSTSTPTSASSYPTTATCISERAPLSLDMIEECFYYLAPYGILICKEHATAIENIDRHLLKQHGIGWRERREVVEYCHLHFPTVAPWDVKLLPSLEPSIKELGDPLPGFQCRAGDYCSFITISTAKLRMHVKGEHGQAWKGDTARLYHKVNVQTFFRAGGLQRYFIVRSGESSTLSAPREAADIVQERLAEWEVTKRRQEEKDQVLEVQVAKTDKTGWFKRTGWLEHLAEWNLAHLAHQIRLPDREEVRLQRAAELVELLIERSVQGLSTLGWETRRWLRSARQEEVDVWPMARLQNPESQARYAGYMVKFVCYLLRIIADREVRVAMQDSSNEEDISNSDSSESESMENSHDRGSSSSRSSSRKEKDWMKDACELFCWTPRQRVLAVVLWEMLDMDNHAERHEAQLEALLDVLTSFIFASTGDNPFSSGLVHFLAVLGIDAEMTRLRTAKNYSYMLAGVVYCIRVLSAERLLPAACRKEQMDEDRERFLQYRKRYLADGSYSPMSEVLSLLAYGKHIALEAGNSGNAYWSKDKKIFYLNGRPIYIICFRKMAQDIVAEAEQMLWEELMWVAGVEDRFTVQLEQLIDDVTFTQRGMSFMQQQDNGLKDKLEWMLTRVEHTEQGRRLQTREGRWNRRQVKRYLHCVDRFLDAAACLCAHDIRAAR
ncbi:uncharacterized protein EI97DRAFT_429630 [Westerdykella ornata]|uniref:Uncharacterized protein n=1 Tax=Westerdykella ornata TaxID=318751 RepID=A0A6A6JTA3_WESOR|nr:uncharacterized protein EI97DRAFT_429630 [Westerdykella ornata]KAF2279841.1 hypothetical protein EI97DRAFT_429630 [Westerdykella ornata]